jgi:predicted acetyltransferase
MYKHDFSEWDGADVDEHGYFGYRYLDHYWTESGRHPFLVRVDRKLGGFALIRERTDAGTGQAVIEMSEFFVLRKYRQRGVGTQIAFQLFDLFPGRWEVAQTAENVTAQRFWRRAIATYTAGNFTESTVANDEQHGPVQSFENFGR